MSRLNTKLKLQQKFRRKFKLKLELKLEIALKLGQNPECKLKKWHKLELDETQTETGT